MSKRERIEALEARVAVAEKRLTALEIEPSDPDEAMPSGCFDCDSTTCRCADPEPVPQWRVLVDEHDGTDCTYCTFGPLAEVLGCLHSLAASDHVGDTLHRGIGWNLARIVAVAEGQVGDGWKADPDAVLGHGNAGSHMCDIDCLIAALSAFDRWRVLGHRAARILRSLLDGAS